jgi:nucleotide-binding universal stress UspA family protein
MLFIQCILHPTDFSERSEPAFRFACALARDYGARLLLLHVAPRPVVTAFMGVVPPEPERYHEQLTDDLIRLGRQAKGLEVDTRLRIADPPADEIIRTARESRCDLIVMGTHGRTGLTRALMGSVAEQVSRRAACPVLTVKMPFTGEAAPKPAAAAAHQGQAAIIL